jgi:predicted nucleic acid-binding protein
MGGCIEEARSLFVWDREVKLFIDTSALVALDSKRDTNYRAACQFRDEVERKRYRLHTSNFVLDETYTLLLLNVGYERTMVFFRRVSLLKAKGLLHVIHVTEDIEDSAWFIFEKFNKDKFWSFTDCTSKAIMELLDINEVFSFDKNFEQMGFTRRP